MSSSYACESSFSIAAYSSRHFSFDSVKQSLSEALQYRRSDISAQTQSCMLNISRILEGGIGFLPIKSIRIVKSRHKYVYDFSVPSYEKFLGGRGAIFLHNSLDACEEAGILPDVSVKIKTTGEDKFRVTVKDNGPGIVKEQIPKIFGKLLYGSKFHRLRQSRGQQGIGISAVLLYSQLTTGSPTKVWSRTDEKKKTYSCELFLNTAKNEPEIVKSALISK